MKLNLSRFFSDRIVYQDLPSPQYTAQSSCWEIFKRILFTFCAPPSYTEANRRTIHCFKEYLIQRLGSERLLRICNRYSLDLDGLAKKGSPLLSRDIAKIVIGARDVNVEDINEYIALNSHDPGFQGRTTFLDLDPSTFQSVHSFLANPFDGKFVVPDLEGAISGAPTEWWARIFYDPFLSDRERLEVCKENPNDTFETFMHNMVARVIKREMNVGTLIPAPNHRTDGHPQFYYVSAKVVTGKGMVSYLIHPVGTSTDLEPVRLFRGTAPRTGELDGISTLITDLEPDIGYSAYESGIVYESLIKEKMALPSIEAGHSLGSTIIQYRLANMDHIKTAYLYCGPGIPEKEVEKFNRKREKLSDSLELIIRQSKRDGAIKFGQVHLGYKVPKKVEIDFIKFHPSPNNKKAKPHVDVYGRERAIHGMEGGISEGRRDYLFYNKNRTRERIRTLIGPPVAFILKSIRTLSSSIFGSRVDELMGLHIGTIQNGKWVVEQIRPD